MNASLRYVFRNLGRRRLRTAAGALGIFLTIALLVAIQIGLDSVSTSYTDLVALQAGKADLLITAQGGHLFKPEPFDPAVVRSKLAKHPEVRGLAPRWAGIVQIQSGLGSHDAMLIGVDPKAEREFDLWGLHPEPKLGGQSCAISQALAKRLDVKPGSRLSVVSPVYGNETALELETIVDRQLILPQEVREFIVVNDAAVRAILGETDRVHLLAGTVKEPASYYDGRDLHASVLRLKRAGESIAADLGMDFDVRLPKAAAITVFQNVASPLRAIFGVFAVLALSVTGLLIYSIVSVAVEERIREYAILRTVGARRTDIFRLVLGESVFLCCIGVLPGVLAGTVVARIIVTLVELAMHAQVGSVTLAFSWPNLLLALAAGTALSIGSALIPALQATRWRIVDALDPLRRGQIRVERRDEGGTNRPLLITGIALSALSVVVFFVLPTAFLSGNSSLIGTVVLCLLLTILLGFTLVAAGALPLLEGVIMRLLAGVLGPSAELARRNLERHRRRNTTTALMFILSVSLVIFVASLVALFSRMSMTMVEHFNGADLRLQSDDAGALGLKTELAAVKGVERVSEVRLLRSRSERGTAYDVVLSDLVGMKQLWLVPFGVDADLPRVLYTNHIRYADGGLEGLLRVANYQPAPGEAGSANEIPPVVLSLAAARFLDVRAGDLVQLAFHLGPDRRTGRFRVAAICETLAGFDNFRSRVANAIGSGMLMPMSSFQHLAGDAPEEARIVRYFLKVAGDEAAQKAAASEIRDRFDLRFRFGVRSAAERKQEAQVMYWTTQVFFGLLLAVAVVISVFALIASMATAVIERRWEMGILRALGLRRSQLFRMFLGEALGLTLSAGMAGGGIGFALAWLFVLEAGSLAEIPVVFTMPYLTFFATFAISVVAGAVAAHLPTRRLLQQPAAEILRQGT
ncbi:MAG: ABC transporter permease [Limisphaerales bacterium]